MRLGTVCREIPQPCARFLWCREGLSFPLRGDSWKRPHTRRRHLLHAAREQHPCGDHGLFVVAERTGSHEVLRDACGILIGRHHVLLLFGVRPSAETLTSTGAAEPRRAPATLADQIDCTVQNRESSIRSKSQAMVDLLYVATISALTRATCPLSGSFTEPGQRQFEREDAQVSFPRYVRPFTIRIGSCDG